MVYSQPTKQNTPLANGIIIGAGAAMLVVGLLIAFSLNAIYIQQISYLTKYGIEVNTYTYGFDNIFFLISTGAFIAILGTYVLVFGCLNHFNAKVRQAFTVKNSVTTVGNFLINLGFNLAALTSANLIRQLYRPISSSSYFSFSIAAIIGGIIVMAVGFFLIRQEYIHNQSITTLTLERNSPPPPPIDDMYKLQ
jgi:hypothetical protein